jgi:acetyl esterase/lipase
MWSGSSTTTGETEPAVPSSKAARTPLTEFRAGGCPSCISPGYRGPTEESRIEPGGIPARVYDPGGARGLLLLGHGGGTPGKDSERFIQLCRRFAEGTGLVVVCIDAVDHGERQPPGPLDPGVPQQWHSRVAP